MTTKGESGLGTVRTVRDRETGDVVGYQALLPRELSTPPADCQNPDDYKEPLGPQQPTRDAARRLLNAAIVELRDKRLVRHGLPVAHYVDADIKARLRKARQQYELESRANRLVSTWRSIDRIWLKDADFYGMPPAAVQTSDLQRFIDYLRDEAEGERTSEPLSPAFVRQIARFLRSVFGRVTGLTPNPAAALVLPPKDEPRVPFLDLAAQRRFFGALEESDDGGELVELRDKIMLGCGMGLGLRVGELLSVEAEDVHLDAPDPYLVVRYGGPGRSPTKSRRERVVELFEPGLGFWRLWMERFYAGKHQLVFAGRNGGYQKHWPEQFPGWAAAAGVRRLSSHIMRHTYAVAMLSGTWGYDPKSLEFVQQQLGHAERSTTERYYGAYEAGTWRREVRQMTGRVETIRRTPITALELVGSGSQAGAQAGASPIRNQAFLAATGSDGSYPRQSPKTPQTSNEVGLPGASTHQAILRLETALGSVEAGEPTGVRQLVDAAGVALAELRRLTETGTKQVHAGDLAGGDR